MTKQLITRALVLITIGSFPVTVLLHGDVFSGGVGIFAVLGIAAMMYIDLRIIEHQRQQLATQKELTRHFRGLVQRMTIGNLPRQKNGDHV